MYALILVDSEDTLYFNKFENLKNYVVDNFLCWFFEEACISVDDKETFETMFDALNFFKKATERDLDEMYFDDIFRVEKVSTVD